MSFLRDVYPSFDFDQKKLDTWHRLLKDQNPEKITRNAERFALESKFPPVIADLRERNHEAYKSTILEQIKEWEKDASRK